MAIGRFSIRYGSSTGFGGGFGIFDALKGTFGLSDPAGISMARARDTQNPYVIPRPVLPAVAPTTARSAPPKVPGQSSRTNQAQIPVSIPKTFAATGPGKLEPLVKKGTQTMSLDLGNLLGTLGSSYIQARYGGPRQPQVMTPTIRAQGPRAGIAAQPVAVPAVVAGGLGAAAGEVYDFFTEDQAIQLRDGMRIDPVTGCVIKKQRRKRKRLATVSDIKDLAALKSVLSPADLKTWIATHPS